MSVMPRSIIVVDSSLPYAVMGMIVNERYLTEEITLAWTVRQLYERAIRDQMKALDERTSSAGTTIAPAERLLFESAVKGERSRVRSLDRTLDDMLYTMKAVMSKSVREGDWDGFIQG